MLTVQVALMTRRRSCVEMQIMLRGTPKKLQLAAHWQQVLLVRYSCCSSVSDMHASGGTQHLSKFIFFEFSSGLSWDLRDREHTMLLDLARCEKSFRILCVAA